MPNQYWYFKSEGEEMNTINIDGKDYPIDSSGAKPEKYYDVGICWILNSLFHRVDGPARIYSNGDQYWFIKDKLIGSSTEGFTQEKFEEYLKANVS